MSRPLRIQYPGATYHIISRGNAGNNIFKEKQDYLIFLKDKGNKENTKKERFAGRPSLEKVFKDFNNKKERDNLIKKASQEHGYTQTEIGNFLDIHYSTVSKIVKNSKFKT